ncbi:MAG: glycine cleavage system aminomethyltransferase GcvT, partial [bacterium]
ICNENGCPIDDLFVYNINDNIFMMVVNASNIDKDFKWLLSHKIPGADISDESENYSILALQGPNAVSIFSNVIERDVSSMESFSLSSFDCKGTKTFFSRTGYTGEDGVEIYVKSEDSPDLWGKIFKAGHSCGLVPAGLGARDTLRLEMGYSLYGHELNEEINALEAGLAWIVNLDDHEFIGRESLVKAKMDGLRYKFIGLEMVSKAIPRAGFKLFSNGKEIGYITSGTHSPSLKKGIALGYVNAGSVKSGDIIEVDIRGRREQACVVKRKFYNKQIIGL